MWCVSLSCCIHVVFLIIIFLKRVEIEIFLCFLSIKIPLQLFIYLKAKLSLWKVPVGGGKEANITSVVNAVKEICFLQQTLPCLMCSRAHPRPLENSWRPSCQASSGLINWKTNKTWTYADFVVLLWTNYTINVEISADIYIYILFLKMNNESEYLTYSLWLVKFSVSIL